MIRRRISLAEPSWTPPPPSLISGDIIEVTAVPIKYSWDFLTVSQQYSLIQQYASLLPEGLLVSDETGPKELLLMKLLSGHGIRMIERWCVFESAILMITNPFHIFSDFLSIFSELIYNFSELNPESE